MDPLKAIVHRVIENLAAKNPESQDKIQRVWQTLLDGPAIRHNKIVRLTNGKLIVHVDSSAWLYQMNLNKKKILERLHEEVPEVKEIFFKIGKIT